MENFIFLCTGYTNNCLDFPHYSDINADATKNTVISHNFLVRKFCGKEQFLHSSGRFARNYAETVAFYKISTPGN